MASGGKTTSTKPERIALRGIASNFRALFTLREGQTASCFDRAQTSRAITAGSGKHDADSARSAFFSERLKKMVDADD